MWTGEELLRKLALGQNRGRENICEVQWCGVEDKTGLPALTQKLKTNGKLLNNAHFLKILCEMQNNESESRFLLCDDKKKDDE